MTKINEAQALFTRIRDAAKQDMRKTLALGALVLVLMVMVGRALVSSRPASARASAGTELANRANAPESAKVTDVITAAESARADNTALRLREWKSAPVKPLSRNLFAIRMEYFPVDGSRAALGVKTSADGEFWGRLEKSLMLQADQRDKRENLLANYRAEAAKLRLDSIMWGAQPKAMIDGKLVDEGDVVAQFRVLKIEPRRIIIEREGIRLEILMK